MMTTEQSKTGTVLMSPEDVKKELEAQRQYRELADNLRNEQQKKMWHLWSYMLPVAATILGASFVGICFFVAFKIMGEAWLATKWF